MAKFNNINSAALLTVLYSLSSIENSLRAINMFAIRVLFVFLLFVVVAVAAHGVDKDKLRILYWVLSVCATDWLTNHCGKEIPRKRHKKKQLIFEWKLARTATIQSALWRTLHSAHWLWRTQWGENLPLRLPQCVSTVLQLCNCKRDNFSSRLSLNHHTLSHTQKHIQIELQLSVRCFYSLQATAPTLLLPSLSDKCSLPAHQDGASERGYGAAATG